MIPTEKRLQFMDAAIDYVLAEVEATQSALDRLGAPKEAHGERLSMSQRAQALVRAREDSTD